MSATTRSNSTLEGYHAQKDSCQTWSMWHGWCLAHRGEFGLARLGSAERSVLQGTAGVGARESTGDVRQKSSREGIYFISIATSLTTLLLPRNTLIPPTPTPSRIPHPRDLIKPCIIHPLARQPRIPPLLLPKHGAPITEEIPAIRDNAATPRITSKLSCAGC